jgi:hypothetical protein
MKRPYDLEIPQAARPLEEGENKRDWPCQSPPSAGDNGPREPSAAVAVYLSISYRLYQAAFALGNSIPVAPSCGI